MDTAVEIESPRTASFEVFRHLGATLERPAAAPASGRSRSAASTAYRPVDRWTLDGHSPASWGRFEVLIAHASPIVAEGLLTTLGRHASVQASICRDEATLRARIASPSPCLVFSDYATAVAGARQLDPGAACAWACVTSRDGEPDIREALSAGVFGYLLADCPIADYVACVQGVGREARYLCERARRRLSEASDRQGLSPRETAVLRLVVDGCSNQDISEQLRITLSTVKVHVGSILKKLGARSRTQAAALAGTRNLLGARAAS